MPKVTIENGVIHIDLSTSDEDADWIKLSDPKATAADRKADEDARRKFIEEERLRHQKD